MTWVKIDDRFYGHRKAMRAWRTRGALGLHLLALTYCASHETDGLVDEAFVAEKLPGVREHDRTVTALIDAGLWEPTDGGWQIHDYLNYNPSAAELAERRRKEAARKAAARAAKSRQRPGGHDADSARSPNGVGAESALTRPDPTPTTGQNSLSGGLAMNESDARGTERTGTAPPRPSHHQGFPVGEAT